MATPDITEPFSAPLSARTTTSQAQRAGFLWDYSIAGLGFQRKAGDPRYQRRSVPIQKQQTDTASEPGEHSLDGFWIRSQSSFHRGAGIKFYEPGDDKDTQYRFDDSRGVDVWTPGRVKTLAPMGIMPILPNGAQYLNDNVKPLLAGRYVCVGGNVYRDAFEGGGFAMDMTGVTGTPSALCEAAGGVALGTDAGIWFWDGVGTPFLVANSGIGFTGYRPLMKYLKGRLIYSSSGRIWECPIKADGTVSTPSVLCNSDDKPNGFMWTSATEGPNCIYLTGAGSGSSAIYRIALKDNGSASPTLGWPYEVASFPSGESVNRVESYLGRYLDYGGNAGGHHLVRRLGHLRANPVPLWRGIDLLEELHVRRRFVGSEDRRGRWLHHQQLHDLQSQPIGAHRRQHAVRLGS